MDEEKFEIMELEESIKYHQKEISILESKLTLGKRLVKIVIDNINPKETAYAYQDVPEYWALQKELTMLAHTEEQMEQEDRLRNLRNIIKIKEVSLNEKRLEK